MCNYILLKLRTLDIQALLGMISILQLLPHHYTSICSTTCLYKYALAMTLYHFWHSRPLYLNIVKQ